MPAKTRRLQARIDEATAAQIAELARIWGPYEPLSDSAVIRRAVALAHRAEATRPRPRAERTRP
jgi:hypothetical protein